jgi:hypothetical protein
MHTVDADESTCWTAPSASADVEANPSDKAPSATHDSSFRDKNSFRDMSFSPNCASAIARAGVAPTANTFFMSTPHVRLEGQPDTARK